MMKTPVKNKVVRRKESKQKIVPFEDVGFTKNWNFESEKFYDSKDVFGVASPLEATIPTVPYTRQSQYPERESFVDWERSNTKRRHDTRDYVRTPTQKTEKYYPTSRPPRPKVMKSKFIERNDNSNGFMESVPFTFPEELKTFSGKSFNELDWAMKGSETGKYFESKPEANKLRNINRADFPETETYNQDTLQAYDQRDQQEINSFGDDFSFGNSRIGNFFNDIDGNFPRLEFGSAWESRRNR